MTKPTPEWHDEAKRLYADGVTVAEIARTMGRSHACVAYAVDHMGARKRAIHRKHLSLAGKTSQRVRAAVRRNVERPVAPPPVADEGPRASPRFPTSASLISTGRILPACFASRRAPA